MQQADILFKKIDSMEKRGVGYIFSLSMSFFVKCFLFHWLNFSISENHQMIQHN